MEISSFIPYHIKQLEEQLSQVELAIVRADKTNGQLILQLEDQFEDIKEKIEEAYDELYMATRDPTITQPTAKLPDGLHFFRYGKIDRLKESEGTPFLGIRYSLEYSEWGGVQDCYNELPEEVRLSAADLLSWGKQHTSNMQLPTVKDLSAYFDRALVPDVHFLCSALITEYMKHFGNRFVVQVFRDNQGK